MSNKIKYIKMRSDKFVGQVLSNNYRKVVGQKLGWQKTERTYLIQHQLGKQSHNKSINWRVWKKFSPSRVTGEWTGYRRLSLFWHRRFVRCLPSSSSSFTLEHRHQTNTKYRVNLWQNWVYFRERGQRRGRLHEHLPQVLNWNRK